MKNKIFILLIMFPLFTFSQSGTWTWMKGDSVLGTNNAVYGTQGVPNDSINPAGDYQSTYWTDVQGNFWLYAGTYAATNDLWKFDVTTNNWTWMNGTKSGALNYGVQGIPSPNNYPGPRLFGTNCWADSNNNLWLFSGTYSSPDLWKYSISTNEWTWMQGQELIGGFYNYPPVFGMQGISNSANTPGDLQECKSGLTGANNKLYLFGGGGYSSPVSNRMWRYDMATNQWACMKGDTIPYTLGNYGIKGVESLTNMPGPRLSYCRWISKVGDFFIFGGDIVDTTSIISGARLNDVWRYRPSTNNWTWVSGSNTLLAKAIYNGYCTPDNNSEPQNKFEYNAITANDCNRTSWLFGGYSSDNTVNDLWTFDTDNYKWTLVSGNPDTTIYDFNYGIKGAASSTNSISPRGGTAMWTDKNLNVWIFGGFAVNRGALIGTLDASNQMWRFQPDYDCMDITPIPGEALSPPNDLVLCTGDTSSVLYNAASITSILPSISYTYQAGANPNFLFHPASTTTYTVNYTNPCDGPQQLVFTIQVIPTPNANFEFNKTIYEINDGNIALSNFSLNASSYKWYENGQLISILPNPKFPIDSSRTYCFKLVVENSEGCKDSITKCIDVLKTLNDDIFIPSAFSPNGDGLNDEFSLVSKSILTFELLLYNRFGEQVAALRNPIEKWNGFFKNRKCDIGTYYYILKYKNIRGESKIVKGDISLIR
jgi:gliding motility-associated-like protein